MFVKRRKAIIFNLKFSFCHPLDSADWSRSITRLHSQLLPSSRDVSEESIGLMIIDSDDGSSRSLLLPDSVAWQEISFNKQNKTGNVL